MAPFRARDPVSGYTHLAGLALACAGAIALLWRARAHEAFVPNLTYAASLVALYAASSAYHLVPGAEAVTQRLRNLDHSAISVFIEAGPLRFPTRHPFDLGATALSWS